MLNRWRYVRYTDDGCAYYECLQCGRGWEGRDDPGYYVYDTGVYVAQWHFCPCCGTRWDGPLHRHGQDREFCYGPRRRRNWEAIQSQPYKPPAPPPFTWAIEVQGQWRNSPEAEWEKYFEFPGLKPGIEGVLWALNAARAHYNSLNKPDPDDIAESPLIWHVRLVAVWPNGHRKVVIAE